MGSKGSASPTFTQPSPMTTTQAVNQQTNQQQTYTPSPLISQYAPQALQMGAAAATTPFSLAPQQIAPFTPMQQQYFSQLQAMQGMTNPYFQQAQGLMGQGAQDVQSGLAAAQQGLATSGQGLGYAQQGFNTSGQGLGYAQRGFNAAGSQIPGVNAAQQSMGTGQNILAGGIPGVSGAGQAVTSDQISQYLNPYAQAALADMQKYIFDPQRVQTMGSATQTAGGVGADRLALVSQNLDKTQADALAQAEAGFYQPAMAMAEQQKQMQLASGLGMGQLGTGYGGLAMGQGQLGLGAANVGLGQGQLGLGMGQLGISQGQLGLGMGQLGLGQGQLGLGMSGVGLGEFGAGTQYGALGTAAQNAALQATGALGQAGTQQQGLNQAQLNALYQNQLMQQAYPFQSAQFLAGLTGGLAPALGGTTTGAGTTMGTGYGTQLPSQPSYGAQLLGLGTAGLGALGSLGTFGNKGSTAGMGLNPATNYGLSPSDYANMPTDWTQQRGGRIGYQEGGSVDDVPEVNVTETPLVPKIPLPMGSGERTGAHLNLNPDVKFPLPWAVQQQQQSGGSGGGSGVLGALGTAVSIGSKILPFFLAQGGAVNPFSAGQGFQEGGDIEDDTDTQPMSDQTPFRVAMAEPASIRNNNPGAQWPGPVAEQYGATGAQNVAGGNKIATFPDPVQGGAAHFALLNRTYSGLPLSQAIRKWSGGNNSPEYTASIVKETGLSPNTLITPELLQSPQGISLVKAMSRVEAGRPFPMSDEQWGNAQSLAFNQPMAGRQYAQAAPMGATASDVYTPLTREQMPYPGAAQDDWGTRAARSPWMSLIAAGAKMATSTQPLGAAIASGIGAGGAELESQRKELATEEAINQKAEALHHQAEALNLQYTKMTPYQAAEVGMRQQLVSKQLQQLELEGLKPFKIGQDPQSLMDIYGVRDLNTGKIVPINPLTGRPQNEAGQAPPALPSIETKPQTPAPLGVEEFRPNLTPTKSTALTPAKGPFATAEAGNIRNIDQQMNKERGALDVQHDQINRLKMDYATVMKDSDKDGFFTRLMTMPGADPDSRVNAMRTANLAATAAGKQPVFSPEKVAAMEEAIKIQKTMGMSFAATISPRDAMQMQLASISAQPGFTQSPQGMQRLIGLYDGLVNHNEARHDFWGRWKQENPRTSTGWEEDFRTKNPVDTFTTRALIENMPNQKAKAALPQAVQYLRQHANEPTEVAKFDRIFNNTSSYFLSGKLDPYAALR